MNHNATNSEEVFKQLGGSFITHLWEGMIGKDNQRSQKLAGILFVLVLAYAGVEVVKVTFRTSFGRKGVSKLRLALATLAFLVLGGSSLHLYLNPAHVEDYLVFGTHSSFLYTGIFFIAFSIYLLVKGLSSSDQVIDQYYRGRSTWLRFLIERGSNPSKVQDLAEPATMLMIGLALIPFNLFLTISFVFCAISYWLHVGLEWYLGLGKVSNTLSNQGHDYSRKGEFSKVIL